MLQGEGVCSVLAVVIVLLLLASSMRPKMRNAAGAGGSCGCDEGVCGRKATPATANASAEGGVASAEGGVASARVAGPAPRDATDSGGAKGPDVGRAAALDGKEVGDRANPKTLDEIKRNAQTAHSSSFARDQSTCRRDYIARTAGTRTGALNMLLSHMGKDATDKPMTFVPFFNAVESSPMANKARME